MGMATGTAMALIAPRWRRRRRRHHLRFHRRGLPSRLAAQSSQLYATNLYNLIMELCPEKDGKIKIDMEDEVVRGATVVHKGEVTWPPPVVAVGAERKPSFSGQIVKPDEEEQEKI